jgi:hypothetical protein
MPQFPTKLSVNVRDEVDKLIQQHLRADETQSSFLRYCIWLGLNTRINKLPEPRNPVEIGDQLALPQDRTRPLPSNIRPKVEYTEEEHKRLAAEGAARFGDPMSGLPKG